MLIARFRCCCIAAGGRVIAKRQAPQSDFVNRMLSMFNFSGDGGPGQMLTGLFTMFLNQTSGLFGPMLGTQGGDGINFMNQLVQQFMTVFGQLSGLWSNRVSRQMASGSSSVSELPEYELIQTSASSLSQVNSRIQRMQKLAKAPSSQSSSQVLVNEMRKTRKLMNDLWLCVDGIQRPDLNLTTTNRQQLLRTGRRIMMQMQDELIQLWRLVSDQVLANATDSQPTASCQSLVDCMEQVVTSPRPEPTTQTSSSTQTIEFEETKN